VPYVAQNNVGKSYRHIGMQPPANSERIYRFLDCKIIHCMQLLDKFSASWIYYVLRRNYKTPPLAPLATSCEYSEYLNLLFLCELAQFYLLLYVSFSPSSHFIF